MSKIRKKKNITGAELSGLQLQKEKKRMSFMRNYSNVHKS